MDAYANDALKKQGEILLNATTFRFDGSDLMPGKIGAGAFWTGMVDFVGGKSAAGRRRRHPEGLGRDQVSVVEDVRPGAALRSPDPGLTRHRMPDYGGKRRRTDGRHARHA